jgi:hypothetical protein
MGWVGYEPTSAGLQDPTTGFGDHTGPLHLKEEGKIEEVHCK